MEGSFVARDIVARVAVSFKQLQPHSSQSEIADRIVPAAASCPTICIIFYQLFDFDYCAAAAARN